MSQWDEGHYLPHIPIVKESGTNRGRLVFDTSATERGHPSLNQCLKKGAILIEIAHHYFCVSGYTKFEL